MTERRALVFCDNRASVRNEKLKTLLLAAILLAVNCYIVRDLFTAGFIAQMGSIDGAHIGIPRYLRDHWRDLGWFQLWYGGMPYQNTYPPLLRILVAGAAIVSGAHIVVAYHAVTATLYALGPVMLFWLAWRLSRSRAFSFGAAMLYSLFSPCALFGPSILRDVGSPFNPRRIQTLLGYGDGPHVSSLTLIPLAIVALDVALEKKRPVFYILAALALASVVLTNWFGGVSLAVAVIAYLLARPQTSSRTWLAAIGIALYAYVLFLPWIPPSTLAAIRTNSQWAGGDFRIGAQHLKYLGMGLIALVFLRVACERLRIPTVVRFAIFFTVPLAAVVFAALWFGINILPQPERYQLEMEMGLILIAVFALRPLAARMGRVEIAVVVAGFLLFCWMQTRHYRHFAWYMDRPIDISRTIEYQAAQWFDRNAHGQRVFAPGSVGFWLNVFNDTPQLSGGFDQGLTNELIPVVTYQVYTGDGAGSRENEIGEQWLKAFGVHAVMVVGPHSRESYRPYHNPHKFEGYLKELWRDGEDVIYEVPSRSVSLAHVMERGDLPPRTPAGGLDVDALRPYTAALDNPAYPVADFRWLAPSRAVINADLKKSQVVSVQVSYHRGWHARVNGRPCGVERDRIGQLVVVPGCEGRCTVELSYDGGAEMWVARILSWVALLGGLFWIGYSRRRST